MRQHGAGGVHIQAQLGNPADGDGGTVDGALGDDAAVDHVHPVVQQDKIDALGRQSGKAGAQKFDQLSHRVVYAGRLHPVDGTAHNGRQQAYQARGIFADAGNRHQLFHGGFRNAGQ